MLRDLRERRVEMFLRFVAVERFRSLDKSIKALKARGALAKLAPLMDHPNERVRLDAATACLDIEPQKADAILQAAAARSREQFDMMDAKRIIQQRSRGQGVVWGVV
jgi:hypothetical protein